MLSLLALVVAQTGKPIVFSEEKVGGVPVSVIRIDPKHPGVRCGVIVAKNFPGTDEPFVEMVGRTMPAIAINGAYFSKDNLKPIGDIVVDGRLVSSGRMGTAFTIADDGTLDIRRVQRHKTIDWTGFRSVLACGPALILDGKVDIQFQEEGFRDPHVTGSTQRMTIGITPQGKIVIAHIRKAVTFAAQAQVMLGLGCHEAMNLDAGASLAMYVNGKFKATPDRRLTNLFAVWTD